MNNNTKIRLRLSKNLFESLTREILAEAKKGDMSGGAYTEAVKMPKAGKMDEKMSSKEKMAKGLYNEVDAEEDTDSMKKMEEKMSSKEKMAKGLYNEVGAEEGKYPVGTVFFKPNGNQTITVKRIEGDKIFVVSDLTPNREFQWSTSVIDDGIRTKEFQLKSSDQNEMQTKGGKHNIDTLKKAKVKLEQRISEMETMTAEEKIEESVKKKKLRK